MTVEGLADDRELGERGVDHALAQRRIVTEEQAERREEHQQ